MKHKLNSLSRWLVRFCREQILYRLPLRRPDPNVVLFIRLDGIGDYILYRNFLPYLREADFMQRADGKGAKKLILVGNRLFQPLVDTFDKNLFDTCFWIDVELFVQASFRQKLTLIFQIRRQFRAATVIQSKHDRPFLEEMLIQSLGAKLKIATEGDDKTLGAKTKKAFDRRYHRLIPTLPITHFEFERNRIFFQHLVGKPISIQKPFFQNLEIPKQAGKICLFVGGSESFKHWSAAHYAALCLLVQKKTPSSGKEIRRTVFFDILGGPSDVETAQSILQLLPKDFPINDLCGKTKLTDIVPMIAAAELLISNETVSHHIAVAVHTPCVCISVGREFGRFSPYPKTMTEQHLTVYPSDDFYKPALFEALALYYQSCPEADLCDINWISPATVFEQAKKFLY
jgi:ADP-heptose:LPS heptosyltransferase